MINRKLQLNATSAMATPALTHSSVTGSLLASNVSANTGFYKISCFTNNRQPSSSGEPVPTGLSILFHWTSQRKLSLTDH
ncbi:Sporulation-specific protein [Trichinella pseudospiralis]